MQFESSITHRKHLDNGLTVAWYRTNGSGDNEWDVVSYSDDSRWLFDNGSAEQLVLLGEVSDGLGKAEVLRTGSGSIIFVRGGVGSHLVGTGVVRLANGDQQ